MTATPVPAARFTEPAPAQRLERAAAALTAHGFAAEILDDAAAHDVYQEHPLHKEFVARNKANFDRIRVYDFA